MIPLYNVVVRHHRIITTYAKHLYFKAALDTSITAAIEFPNYRFYVRPTVDRPGYINTYEPEPLPLVLTICRGPHLNS